MGITIHYEGVLRSASDLPQVVAIAKNWAARLGAPCEEVDEPNGTLERVIDDEDCDYEGRVRGVVVQPHEGSEPLHLLVGDDLFMQDYCKTQFASPEIHVSVVELFRALSGHFDQLAVTDEGEFWESSDRRRLEELWDGFEQALADVLADNPEAQTQVRLPSGRIIDALT